MLPYRGPLQFLPGAPTMHELVILALLLLGGLLLTTPPLATPPQLRARMVPVQVLPHRRDTRVSQLDRPTVPESCWYGFLGTLLWD